MVYSIGWQYDLLVLFLHIRAANVHSIVLPWCDEPDWEDKITYCRPFLVFHFSIMEPEGNNLCTLHKTASCLPVFCGNLSRSLSRVWWITSCHHCICIYKSKSGDVLHVNVMANYCPTFCISSSSFLIIFNIKKRNS